MILLDHSNRILQEAIQSRLELPSGTERKEVVDITLADFDGVQFHVTNDATNKGLMKVSLQWRCAKDLLANGGSEILKATYGNLLQATPETSYDVTLQINLDTDGKSITNLPEQVGLLKRHLFAGPFKKVFEAVEKGTTINPISIQYRDEEAVFIKAEGDRVMVIFSILFRDPDDQVLAKVFLQEFAEAKRTVNNAPSVSFSQKDPPLELKGVKGIRADAKYGFVSFVLFKNHIEAKNREKTINSIQLFRDYLMYHIKCSKAYMHDRMRKRVESLLQVLNRAKQEPMEPKEKKTITGKTFTRTASVPKTPTRATKK